jgi:hypothetical protein
MAKYRKKPVVIEATQYIPDASIPDGIEFDHATFPFVRTLEGPLRVSPYDWIITGIKGEHYPCKPDIFEQLYEAVDETETTTR